MLPDQAMTFKRPRHFILRSDNSVEEVDLMTWALWLEECGSRHVGYTQVNSQVTVSTVFLGLDMRFFGDGPPILFETLIMGGPHNGDMWRYSSWDDAESGHAMSVKKARKAAGQKISEPSPSSSSSPTSQGS